SAMDGFGVEVYLTGQGGWLSRGEFQSIVGATRDLLIGAAAAMKADQTATEVSLGTPVATTLRSVVDSVGGKVAKSLAAAYPALKTLPAGPGNTGELGVTYCSAQSSDTSACQVR